MAANSSAGRIRRREAEQFREHAAFAAGRHLPARNYRAVNVFAVTERATSPITAKEQQMHGVSRRSITFLATALSVVGLSTASAQAHALHVTGQQTTITPSTGATQFLAAHHVAVSALGPATIANGALTLPIVRGFVTTPKLNANVVHAGGVKFTSGTRSFALRAFVLTRVAHRTFLSARIGAKRLILARVTNLTQSISGTTALITGELKLSAEAARRVNRVLGAQVVSGGADIGGLKSTVTVS